MGMTIGTGGASGCSATLTSPKKNIFCFASISDVWLNISCSGFGLRPLKCNCGKLPILGKDVEVEGGGVACEGLGICERGGEVGVVGESSCTSTLIIEWISSWRLDSSSSSDSGRFWDSTLKETYTSWSDRCLANVSRFLTFLAFLGHWFLN